MTFHRAAHLDDVWEGELCGVRVAGEPVLLVRFADGIRAYADRCAHLGMPLSRGRLEGDELACPAHAWRYDMRTGEGTNPRHVRLARYAVKVVDDEIFVCLEEAAR